MKSKELTLTSMLLIRALDLRIGRPTSDGNMCSGKLLPAKPHLTNLNKII